MKANSSSRNYLISLSNFLILIFILSSCSFLSKRDSVFGGKKEVKKETVPQGYVSKADYDQLKMKYDKLNQNKEGSESSELNLEPKPGLVDDLSKAAEDSVQNELAETVDMFGNTSAKKTQEKVFIPEIISEYNPKEVNAQTEILELARKQQANNQISEAMSTLKQIENSPIDQIKIRARFTLGEILLAQKQYDLAMQIFEQIITEFAFSGIIIPTLGRLIVCSEKLQLKEKKDKYYSILYDFFEST